MLFVLEKILKFIRKMDFLKVFSKMIQKNKNKRLNRRFNSRERESVYSQVSILSGVRRQNNFSKNEKVNIPKIHKIYHFSIENQ